MNSKVSQCLVFCLALGFNTALLAQNTTPPIRAKQPVLSESFYAKPFNAIDINGPINVQINAQRTTSKVELIGDANSLAQVYAAVKKGVLYLGLKPGANVQASNILAKVNVPQLNQLRYAGSGNVVGEKLTGPLTMATGGVGTVILLGTDIDLQNLNAVGNANVHVLGIKSRLLDITDNSSGKINLGGDMVLNNLNYNGSGPLTVQWVNSSNVTVTGRGNGRVFLAGIAKSFNATVGNRVFLDARYLHADRGFINTSGDARADVWLKTTLGALASGNSNIYYYNHSKMVGDYMRSPSAVLNMSGLDGG